MVTECEINSYRLYNLLNTALMNEGKKVKPRACEHHETKQKRESTSSMKISSDSVLIFDTKNKTKNHNSIYVCW